MAIAYRHEEDDDKQLRDAGAPLADHGESAGGRAPGRHAAHSLAEIDAQYGGAGDIAAASGTDLDQLSLHGAAPEPSHVDPVATAVAQTELERPAAAAHGDHAQDADAGDAGGLETGAVQHAPGGARQQPAHDVPSPSALSGAAQGLQVIATAAPAPGAAPRGNAHPLSQAEMRDMLEDSPAPAAAPRGNAHPLSQTEMRDMLEDSPAPAAAPRGNAHPLSQTEMHEMLEDSPAPAAAPRGNAHPLTQAEMHEMLEDSPAPAAAPRGNAHPLTQAEMHEMLEDSPAPAAAPRPPAATARGNAHPLSQAEMHEMLEDSPAPAAAPRPPAATARGNAHPLSQAEMHEMLEDSPAPAAAPRPPAATARGNAHPLSQAEMHEMLEDSPAPAAAPKGPAAAPGGNAHPLSQAEMHEFLDDPAPTGAPRAPGGAPKAAGAATSWQAAARTYNQRHGLVAQFNAATGNACGSGGDADPEAIAAWQKAHGISADGRIGPVTLGAATRVAAAPAQADAPAPAAAPKPAIAPTLASAPAVVPAPQAVKPVALAAPAPAVTPAPQAVKPVALAAPAPAVTPAPQVARPAVAAPVKPAEAPAVAANRAPAAPSATANSFTGTDDLKKPGKDRWTSYGKGDSKTYGWDLGGTHGVKNPGGDAGNAVSAVSNVEGRYDSVQTYDAGILSFGIMQWTLHAGSLQKFLGFLKDKSGPEGRAAFQDDFAAKGIDVKPTGGQYQLSYNGKEYALGADGEGKDAIDKLVRQDKDTARKWAEIFAAAGADPRVQKAEFERAKEMYQETQGIKFTDKVVDQSLKACKKTFHAKYRDQYGKAESWMTASPKAGALFFSMRVNNPKYANAAFLKAIDAFYDAHGTDRAKWPANWGEDFGNQVEARCKETLDTWHSEGGNEGRVEKTLRFWNQAQAQGGTPTATAAPAAKPAAQIAAPASKDPAADGKLDAARQQKLRAQYAAIMKQFVRGQIDQGDAVKSLIAYDEKLNGGKPSVEGLVLLPVLLADLVKATLARSAAATPAPAKPTEARAEVKAPAKPEAKPEVKGGDAPTGANRAVTDAPVNPAAGGPAIAKKLDLPGLPTVRAFLPPGGVKGTVDLFVFFHGMYAHHDAKSKSVDDPERESHMAEAVAASGRNMVALSPAAEMTKAEWPMWSALSKHNGFAQVVEQSLARLSTDLGTPLTAGTISIAGHSAGGSAVGEAADQLGDAVHDVTLQDGGYTSASFLASHDKLVHWLLTGKTDKTVRVITHGDPGKVSEGNVLKAYLNPDNLQAQAAKLQFAGVSVSTEPGNADERSVGGMHLHHRLVIHGLPASRTISVFNFNAENHYEVRNKTMGHLIGEGPNTDFATSGAPRKDAPGANRSAQPASLPAHAAKVSDTPKVSDAPKHAETKPAAPEPTVNAASSTGSLQDLDALVAGAHNAQVSTVAQHLHDLAVKFAQLTTAKALDGNEIKADGRADLVKDIGTLHAEVAALDHCGLEQPRLEPIKARMFRALQELSPYHSQGRNVDILERGEKDRARAHAGGIKTRTCNVTSLSMALEGLGKGAKDYGGDRDVVLAVAKVFHPELTAAQLVGGGSKGDFGALEALRLPDFMELAAIAQLAKGKTDEASIMAAASDAFDQILMMGFLRDLAKQFGVSAEIKYFSYDGKQTHTVEKKGKTHEEAGTVEADKLGGSTKDQRHAIDDLIDLRNKAEALEGGDSKKHDAAVKKYEDAKAKQQAALSGKAIENSVPLESYKQAVIDYIGSELASGAAIETHVIGHFVRLRAVYADHVVIDDPAQAGRAHKKVLWEEARAEGLFDKRIVLRP